MELSRYIPERVGSACQVRDDRRTGALPASRNLSQGNVLYHGDYGRQAESMFFGTSPNTMRKDITKACEAGRGKSQAASACDRCSGELFGSQFTHRDYNVGRNAEAAGGDADCLGVRCLIKTIGLALVGT